MRLDQVRALLARITGLFVIVFFGVSLSVAPVHAQDAARSNDAVAADEEDDIEEVTVTGSRLKRDTYTSISPLQVISGQVSREVGLVDPSTILQEAPSASGVQIDLTFGGFVVDNGPGASTVDLRGLGAARTLFLVNGRRLAPSGVEGSPTSPDTNLIPGSLVQQYEVLLDGASSVYGSDALAGVVNVILRKDFDGFEFEAFSNVPASGSSEGGRNQLSASWGYNGDRGFIGIGAEYREIDDMTLADRKWSNQCEKHAEVTTTGEIRTEDLYYSNIFGQRSPGDCKVTALSGYVTELGAPSIGTMLYRQGFSNLGVPNLSDYFAFSTPVDTTGDGFADVSFVDHNLNGNTQFVDIIPDLETTSALAYGEYTFSGEANLTPYFELQYSRRETSGEFFAAQLFPFVNALNPFNPCNPLGAGVDCGLAYDSLLDNPNYAADFAAIQGLTPAQFRDFGIVDLYTGAVGPIPVQPVVHVRGDRGSNSTDVKQYRAVAGIRGDIPFLNFGSFEDFSFDFFVSSSESDGDSRWTGVRGDRLDLALGNYSSTGTPCNNDFGVPVASDTAPGCVPVNMFADSLYANIANNDFATPQERSYLFGERTFKTKYTQDIASFYMNGDLFELPAGEVLFGLGAEYRHDAIDSIPNETAGDGLFFGFSADQGAIGEKDTEEFFAEVEAPLLAGVPAFQELTVNLSTRHTKDEFYGGAWTYSGKLAWRPVESLLLRGTVGTSYRAPNMRENFLAGQTGFNNFTDPCVIPDDAIDPVTGYDPSLDQRSPEVIANCVADPDVDPFTFTNGGIQTYNVEVSSGGALDLSEE
ncbi:MAG: TonB-dependent receptor, partial [Gammaproteobacteria bacterium]|nr:TonB-dependent receptor [Gammaproteobacteria bacterium]